MLVFQPLNIKPVVQKHNSLYFQLRVSILKLINYETNKFNDIQIAVHNDDKQFEDQIQIPISVMINFLQIINYDMRVYNSLYDKRSFKEVVSSWQESNVNYKDTNDLKIYLRQKCQEKSICSQKQFVLIPYFLSHKNQMTTKATNIPVDSLDLESCQIHIEELLQKLNKPVSVGDLHQYVQDHVKPYEYSDRIFKYVIHMIY